MRSFIIFLFTSFIIYNSSNAQSIYRYKIDLKKATNNEVQVELIAPKVKSHTIHFSFPKIIPGTYMISDYGKFISNVKAFDEKGEEIPVRNESEDQWLISNANHVYKITYTVEGIFDAKKKHPVLPMAATSIEPDKDFVINSPGFFGYFDRMQNIPVEVEFKKPEGYYASTSLEFSKPSSSTDIFKLTSIHDLYDKPIMYSIPDTASLQVGNCSVLFSVYSSSGTNHAIDIKKMLEPVMGAALKYLGGKLPADKYAFIYYLHNPKDFQSFPRGLGGALEHTTSSFYYIPDLPLQKLTEFITVGSAHEFFHIITPLTIASHEIKEFNYDKAVMSKHLWLYEGSTEYTANYIQVRYGLISFDEFLHRMSDKITNSLRDYNDTLPFTELSTHSADIYNSQYGNVYEKGALINWCLDLYLLHLSHGKYSFRDLEHELGKRYGIHKGFDDPALFDEITKITFPEVRDFFRKYVEGNQQIPYDYFLGLAGIQYTPSIEKHVFTLGNIFYNGGEKGPVVIRNISQLNEFGQKLGYKVGDEVYSFNGTDVTAETLNDLTTQIKENMKEGEIFTVKIGRKNAAGSIDTIYLKTPAFKVTTLEKNILKPMENLTSEQQMIQHIWLTDDSDKNFTAKAKE